MVSSLGPTFVASIRAVGTGATMAGAGFYLHRQNHVTPQGKTMLALIAQQVTIPAFLFAKIIYCPSDRCGSSSGGDGDEVVCPSVANRIGDLWIILLWPCYVVMCGLFTGYLAARISDTPPSQARSCMAACAFPNSTGLAITLLSVIHKQFSSSAELGKIDPTAFLSVYLLLYPVLQWGLGGWLLAPVEHATNEEPERSLSDNIKTGKVQGLSMDREAGEHGMTEANPLLSCQDSTNSHYLGNSLRLSHILNYEPLHQSSTADAEQEIFGFFPSKRRNRGQGRPNTAIDNTALENLVKELSFASLGHFGSYEESQPNLRLLSNQTLLNEPESSSESDDGPLTIDAAGEATSIFADINSPSNGFASTSENGVNVGEANATSYISRNTLTEQQIRMMQGADIMPLTVTLLRIARKVFQPPVTAALLGLFIASFRDLRGVLVNIYGDKGKQAPLQFLYDGIYSVGQSAVPINMIILGINLSSTFQNKSKKVIENHGMELSNKTMIAVVVGKMIVMPVIGILSAWFLEHNYNPFPDEIDATCYLVMMIVFITPTANNVMIMVELSGSSSKEEMAKVIGWQYVVSPVVLSLVLSVVVRLASCHFDASSVCKLE